MPEQIHHSGRIDVSSGVTIGAREADRIPGRRVQPDLGVRPDARWHLGLRRAEEHTWLHGSGPYKIDALGRDALLVDPATQPPRLPELSRHPTDQPPPSAYTSTKPSWNLE